MAINRRRKYVQGLFICLVVAGLLAQYSIRAAIAVLVLYALIVGLDSRRRQRLIERSQLVPEETSAATKKVHTAPIFGPLHQLFELTGGRVRIANPSPLENHYRDDVAQCSRYIGPAKIIIVVGPKGEAGKTTDALGLAQGLAASGASGGIVLLDFNVVGNAAQRVGFQRMWPSVDRLHRAIRPYFEGDRLAIPLPLQIFRGNLADPHVFTTDMGIDIVGRSGQGERPLTAEGARAILEAAKHLYTWIIVDGTNQLKLDDAFLDDQTPGVTNVMRTAFDTADIVVHAVTTLYDSHGLADEIAPSLQRSGKPVITIVNESTRSPSEVINTVGRYARFSSAVRVIRWASPLDRRDFFWWGNLTGGQQRQFIAAAAAVAALACGDDVKLFPRGRQYRNLKVRTPAVTDSGANIAPSPISEPAQEIPPPISASSSKEQQQLEPSRWQHKAVSSDPLQGTSSAPAAADLVSTAPSTNSSRPTVAPEACIGDSRMEPLSRRTNESGEVTPQHGVGTADETVDESDPDDNLVEAQTGENSFEDIVRRVWPASASDKTALAKAAEKLRRLNPELMRGGREQIFAGDMVKVA